MCAHVSRGFAYEAIWNTSVSKPPVWDVGTGLVALSGP